MKNIPSLQFKEILIGMELNDMDQKILEYLKALLEKVPCRKASFLHVIPSIPMVDVIPYETMDDIVLDSQWIDSLKSKMNRDYGAALPVKSTDTVIWEGDIQESIVEASQTTPVELLVLGQESDRADRDLSAASLTRNAHSNVLIIPEECAVRLKKIMVPIDFSDSSLNALQYAVSLANSLGKESTIECVNVFAAPNLSSYKLSRSAEQLESMFVNRLREHLFELIHQFETDVSLEATVILKEFPSTARYLYSHAEKSGADIVVLGKKGHSKLQQLLMGSVTENFLSLNKRFAVFVIQ